MVHGARLSVQPADARPNVRAAPAVGHL